MRRASIIGATTWGNTIGNILARRGKEVTVWAKTDSRARELNDIQKKLRRNSPDTPVLQYTASVPESVMSADIVFFAVPAQTVRQTARQFKNHIPQNAFIISLAKGLEATTGKRMSEVLFEELPQVQPEHICVLSGPNLSQEINRGLPATSVLAARTPSVAQEIQFELDGENFSIFTSSDIVGVELCGSLKNVIALGAGMVDGLGLGNNAKATLITLGWQEAVKIGCLLGADESTFYGLAGLGDLITTSAGSLSRNHYVGREVASGRPLADVKASMSNIAEGIDTAMAVHRLNHRLKLELNVMELIYKILFQSFPPLELARRLGNGFRK